MKVQSMRLFQPPARLSSRKSEWVDRFEAGRAAIPTPRSIPSPALLQLQREQRYCELGGRLQAVLEGPTGQAPPNWAALALKPTRQVRQLLELMGGDISRLWPALAGPALADPKVLLTSSLRVAHLLRQCPSRLASQLRDFLMQGSRAIEASLTPSLVRFLDWQQAHTQGGEDCSALLRYLGRAPQDAARLLGCSGPFDNLKDCCDSAVLLYHQACCRPEQRAELINRANQRLLYAEQKLVLQPIYQRYPALEPVFELLTPFVQLQPEWSLYDYAGSGRVLDLNWSHWEDRWPAVQDYARVSADESSKAQA